MHTQQIIRTVGPPSIKDSAIVRLSDLGVSLFRINLSHSALEDVADAARWVLERGTGKPRYHPSFRRRNAGTVLSGAS